MAVIVGVKVGAFGTFAALPAIGTLTTLWALWPFRGLDCAVAVGVEPSEMLQRPREEFIARDIAVIVGVGTRQLMHAAAQAHPEVRAAQFTTVLDEVQIGFYGVMRGCFSLDGACASVPADWYTQMATAMLTDRATLSNYRHYVAAGSYHTILAGPEFYSERSAGIAFKNWLKAMLDDDERPGARWRNVACPGCLP